MKITAREARRQKLADVRSKRCPYCNAPPGEDCARKFRYLDDWDPTDYSRENWKKGPNYGQKMWHEFHKPRAEQVILDKMFIIPEAYELADLY